MTPHGAGDAGGTDNTDDFDGGLFDPAHNPAAASSDPEAVAERAFGSENRALLLRRYFEVEAPEAVGPEAAWRHVYRLLMWIDRTIGIAHCYESDKCQPGRPWYGRSLYFHDWLSRELAVPPAELSRHIDWLFTTAVTDLTRTAAAREDARLNKAREQRAPFNGRDMPLPGEDPELEDIIETAARRELGVEAPQSYVRSLSSTIQAYMRNENKRKNLVGEGFEDTLASILRLWEPVASSHDVLVRRPLHALPGFHPPRGTDKTKNVDLALVRHRDGRRILVSCKWSIRSDREEQFATDFDAYARLESAGESFDYVLVTNEFDPARLAAACDNRLQNSSIFTHVVHVNPAGVAAAYGAPTGRSGLARGAQRAMSHMASGRLRSLDDWLSSLV
jgi:hypothetical protein